MPELSVGAERHKAWAPISKLRYISTSPRSVYTEEMAYQSEAFVAARYGLEPNKVKRADGGLEPLEEGDLFVTHHGKRFVIDVKWTRFETGKVVTWIGARVKADIYILVVGKTVPDLKIAGWTPGDDHRKRFGDLGHGRRNVTTQDELRKDVDALMSRLGKPQVVDPTPEPGFDPNDYPRSAWEVD